MNHPSADPTKPVRQGDIYCSPRCGFCCTRAAYDQAVQEAAELAERMGEGWTPRVWENWGWNYDVGKEGLRITVARSGSSIKGGWVVKQFTAWINVENTDDGPGTTQFISDDEDPIEALNISVRKAKSAVTRIQNKIAIAGMKQ